MSAFVMHSIDSALGNTALLSAIIVLSAFFLEDLTTIVVGILAAEGFIAIPLALLSLCVGIILGDATLYLAGAYARTHPRLARYIDHDFTASFRTWLEGSYPLVIFSGHFVPGLRFTTYLASGFFRRPLSVFIPSAIVGGLSLGIALFTLSYWFGSVTSAWMRPARWLIALLFIGVLVYVSRRNLIAYRVRRDQQLPSPDAQTTAPATGSTPTAPEAP